MWDRVDFADISYFHKQFVLMKNDAEQENVAAFRWENGILTGLLAIDGNLQAEKEYAYLHLQKRKMVYDLQLRNKLFFVISNEFLPESTDWKTYAERWILPDVAFEKEARWNNRKNQIKNICDGAIWFCIKRLCDKSLIKNM